MADFIKRLQFGKQYEYETYFKGQNTQPVGKIGVVLADMGMPEDYDFTFYRNYINHVFHYILPKFIQPMVLADRGICLIDPENPMAREPFQPKQLVDALGSTTNKDGKPYVECNVTWRGPGTPKNKWDHGYFLYMEEGKGGGSDICQKTGAKVRGWYYGHLLPEKKVAWAHQCEKIYTDAVDILKQRYPEVEFRHAKYVYPENMQQAVKNCWQLDARRSSTNHSATRFTRISRNMLTRFHASTKQQRDAPGSSAQTNSATNLP